MSKQLEQVYPPELFSWKKPPTELSHDQPPVKTYPTWCGHNGAWVTDVTSYHCAECETVRLEKLATIRKRNYHASLNREILNRQYDLAAKCSIHGNQPDLMGYPISAGDFEFGIAEPGSWHLDSPGNWRWSSSPKIDATPAYVNDMECFRPFRTPHQAQLFSRHRP